MRGKLANVFEIGGKTVVALADYVGDVQAGDVLVVGERRWSILHTSVMGGSKVAEAVASGRPPTIGAEISAIKADVALLTGQEFETIPPNA